MSFNVNYLYPKPAYTVVGPVQTPVPGQRLTVSTVSITWTTPFNANSTAVAVDIQGDDVWVTFDGTTPSASNGHRLYVKEKLLWSRATATAAKFIRVTTDATLQASEFQV